jgi:hypothetical protein
MTATEIIQLTGIIGTSIVGLGGVLAAMLTVFLNYKGRSAPFKQALYAKQIEGCVEVYTVVQKFHDQFQGFVCHHACVLGTEDVKLECRRTCVEVMRELANVEAKWTLFMPHEMNQAIHDLKITFWALTVPADPRLTAQYPQHLQTSRDPGMAFNVAYIEVIRAARKTIGTDPLTKEVFAALGHPKNEQ